MTEHAHTHTHAQTHLHIMSSLQHVPHLAMTFLPSNTDWSLVLTYTLLLTCLAALTWRVRPPAPPPMQYTLSMVSPPSIPKHSISSHDPAQPSPLYWAPVTKTVVSSRTTSTRKRSPCAMIESPSQESLKALCHSMSALRLDYEPDSLCLAMSKLSLDRRKPKRRKKTVRFAEERNEVRLVANWIWRLDVEERLGSLQLHSPRTVHVQVGGATPDAVERDDDGDIVMSG